MEKRLKVEPGKGVLLRCIGGGGESRARRDSGEAGLVGVLNRELRRSVAGVADRANDWEREKAIRLVAKLCCKKLLTDDDVVVRRQDIGDGEGDLTGADGEVSRKGVP